MYIPIAVAVIALIVAMTGLLPHQATLPIIILIAWAAAGIGMIYERRRRMVRIAVPASVLVGMIALGVLGLIGAVLAWMGTDRLASSDGPTLLAIGCFLLLVAVFAPLLRLADAVMRFTFRTLVRLSKPPPPKARQARPARRRLA
ncbi:MAG: hypothetical protein ACRDJU_05320 [Actinomycetota bacterium]